MADIQGTPLTPSQERMDQQLAQLHDRELGLDQVLRRLVEAAVEWVGARYGALGVLGEDQFLSRFITVGMDDDEVAAIGHMPQGRGVLGELIRHPVPLRLAEVSEHPSSCGFPPNHPTMHSFLGMPIRAGSEVYGNLYLADKRGGGQFDARDESLLRTLALAAGGTIEYLRSYGQFHKRELQLAATAKVATALLADTEQSAVLRLATEQAMHIADADLGVAAVPTSLPGTLSVEAALGVNAAQYQDQSLPVRGTFLGEAMRSGGPVMTADLTSDPRVTAGPGLDPRLGPALAVPLRDGSLESGTRGVLMLVRHSGRPVFGPDDVKPLTEFAAQAVLGFQLAERRALAEELRLVRDRDRIARDLHDLALQRMIGAGMSLQSIQRLIANPDARDRVVEVVGELDETARAIRSTVFELQGQHIDVSTHGVRARVVEAVQQAAPSLGVIPALRMEGPLDTEVSSKLEGNLTAVLLEALSNVAQHAHAHHVGVTVAADSDEVVVTVDDDGIGIPETATRRIGLANLADRARDCGGTFSTEKREPSGTRLRWRAPLHPTAPR